MRTKTEIRNVRLYLFWSLLKIPRIFSITGNCKQKIWLKQIKAAPALDFSYFQHASKLVTHHSKRSETNGFQTPFLVSDPLFDPLTVLGLLIDSAPHIGFHAVCAVLFHFFRDMAIYVVPRSLLGTARKAAPPNGGAALRFLQPCGACCQRSSCCFIHTSMTRL